MYIEKGIFIAVCLLAIFFATSWLMAYYRAAKIFKVYEDLKGKDSKLKVKISRLTKELDLLKTAQTEQSTSLTEIGAILQNVQNPLGALRQVYDILEKQDMALVMNSPLAFVDQDGKNTFSATDDAKLQTMRRIKKNIGGTGT